MLNKKLLPLTLVYADKEKAVEGRTRFQKMIFLAQKQSDRIGSIENYDFIPYDYGPFSKELYDDIDELVENGIIKERVETSDEKKKYFYELTEKGRDMILSEFQGEKFKEIEKTLEEIKKEFNSMELPKLLDTVYSRYPEYAENSVF